MNPETLQDVALAVAAERSIGRVLEQIVTGLAAQPAVALARVWLIDSGDICKTCSMRGECPDQTRCLHLLASAGTSLGGRETWSRLEGAFRRFPLGVRKIGRIGATGTGILIEDIEKDHSWIARPEWVRHERISSFAGQPLVFRNEVLGVLGVFNRGACDGRTFAWLRTFADHAAIAIAHTRVLEEVEQLKNQLAEAQRLSFTGSFTWRIETDEITWSDQTYRIFGINRGTHITLALIGSRIHPEDRAAFQERLERARLLLPERGVRYIHVVARSRRNERGDVEYTGAVQDVTEQRLSDEALDRLRSELAHVARVTSLGALTASIAHEVNQPLLGIVTNASTCLRMLGAEPPNVAGACETARRTIRDGNRASEVIARLRALFDRKGTTTESLDLNEATREVIALSLSELQEGRVILRTDLADDLPWVSGDRVQLQQVILNLLRNAADAMTDVHDRARVLVISTARDEGDAVRLIMQDAGTGFDIDASDRMFDAFYTTKSSGMGMGLSVSRSIIESHHGRLWAAANDGAGATFSFSIPCSPEGALRPADVMAGPSV
jgi:signal transduction histidine kinase